MWSKIDRRDTRNALAGFLAAYAAISFACFLYLVISWSATAPHTPDPSRGLVYLHNEHGSITYFSAFQATSCALLLNTSPLLFFLGIALAPKKDVVSRTGSFSFSMRWKPDDPRRLQRVGFAIGTVAALTVVFLMGPSLVASLNAIGVVTGF